MIVVLPWPHKDLSPNARKHWAALSVAKKKARETAHYATLDALGGRAGATRASLAGDAPLPVTVRFYPPDRRHRDDDNMVAAFKASRDGIADALGVNDRRFRPHYFFEDACKPGRVEVVFPSPIRAADLVRASLQADNENGPSACGNTEPGPDHERTGDAP